MYMISLWETDAECAPSPTKLPGMEQDGALWKRKTYCPTVKQSPIPQTFTISAGSRCISWGECSLNSTGSFANESYKKRKASCEQEAFAMFFIYFSSL